MRGQPQNPFGLREPAILVHGLFSRGRAWHKAVQALERDFMLVYGGDVRAQHLNESQLKPADLYTFNFSHKYDLSYREQAKQLATGVRLIKKINHAKKVILIGHSMGGLAARAYIQLENGSKNVSTLITIGTPHYGSPLALLRGSTQQGAIKLFKKLRNSLTSAEKRDEYPHGWLQRTKNKLIKLSQKGEHETIEFFNSEAFLSLAPNSEALEELNRAPLPSELRYVFIAGGLTRNFHTRMQARAYLAYRRQWLKLTGKAALNLSNNYLREPYLQFEKYLFHYLKTDRKKIADELIDFDGAVPFISQYIHHFRKKPLQNTVIPVNISHNRQTKNAIPLYTALAVAGCLVPAQARKRTIANV